MIGTPDIPAANSEMDDDMNDNFPLSLNESVVYIKTGRLPRDFGMRVRAHVEHAKCVNCDDVLDMNRVFGNKGEEVCWCPLCCEDRGVAARKRV